MSLNPSLSSTPLWRRKKKYWFLFLLFPLLLLLAYLAPNYVFINTSPSAPLGIYLAVPGKVSYYDYAVVELPKAIYLPHEIVPEGYGMIKKARAFPGDTYTVDKTSLTVTSVKEDAEALMDMSHVSLAPDSEEVRPITRYHVDVENPSRVPISLSTYLPHIPSGDYVVGKGSILFLNDPHDSLDSRYLGPIAENRVKTKLVLVCDFNHLYDTAKAVLPTSWFTPEEDNEVLPVPPLTMKGGK